ncbi:hypothetical protein NESM_000120100 [Novymonas esmeraldas]|uniref:Uncharacterized protein n=1 Tax=Novymonas esmeraldas TaxID=1808958 RepID=A0AAW0F603_9TRYP
MKSAVRLGCLLLLQAAAMAAVVARAATGESSSSSSLHTGPAPPHPHTSNGGGDNGTDWSTTRAPPATVPPARAPLVDAKWTNITLQFFIIFVSVSGGVGLVALVVILCAYCRRYKLLDTSDDSDTESLCSSGTSGSSSTEDSDSSDEVRSTASRQRRTRRSLPPGVPQQRSPSQVSDPLAYERALNEANAFEASMLGDEQSSMASDVSYTLAEETPSLGDDAASAGRSTGSRLSLASGRRGSFRRSH